MAQRQFALQLSVLRAAQVRVARALLGRLRQNGVGKLAFIGSCLALQAGTSIPVRHWVEVLDEALAR